eukprot:14138565-Ditylum_brightwellii.AAC.1
MKSLVSIKTETKQAKYVIPAPPCFDISEDMSVSIGGGRQVDLTPHTVRAIYNINYYNTRVLSIHGSHNYMLLSMDNLFASEVDKIDKWPKTAAWIFV